MRKLSTSYGCWWRRLLLGLWHLVWTCNSVGGVHALLSAHTYRPGDSVKVRVNKLTSLRTLFPKSFYNVPVCQPAAGIKGMKQNLGQHLTGDEIRTSRYTFQFGTDVYCRPLCINHLGRHETAVQSQKNHMATAIHDGFHANWLLDGLPAAYQSETTEWITTKFAGGFPLGYVADPQKENDDENGRAYVYNHINFIIHYHPVHDHDGDDADLEMSSHDEFRIVRFIVEPFSIRHHFQAWGDDEAVDLAQDEDGNESSVAKIVKSRLAACRPQSDQKKNKEDAEQQRRRHVNFDEVRAQKVHPQPASGKVLFTYDVIWVKDMETHWSDRWDIYLTADGMRTTENHVFSTIVSLVLLATLTSMIVAVLLKNLQRDFRRYNRVATEEEKEEALEEYGWKLVHADVFRPPAQCPLVLAVLLGTGGQLLTTSVVCLLAGMLGIVQPMHRGKMVIAQLVCYSLSGTMNGYITGYMYRMMGGTKWRPAAIAASFGYSGLAFSVFFIVNCCLANSMESTMRVPFGALVAILVMWLLVCTPLTYFFTWVGFFRPQLELPTKVNPTPRRIPAAPWYTSLWLSMLVAGIFPFVPCFFEVYDTLCTLWLDAYDPFYAFFFFIGICALILSVEMTILLTYFQLVREDYTWWWRSFFIGGSTAVYIFGYVVYYHAQHLKAANHLPSWFLYYGYMLVACIGLACAAGFAGFTGALIFTRTIFASVKID